MKLNPWKGLEVREYPAVVASCYGITNPRIKIPGNTLDYFDMNLEHVNEKISAFVKDISNGLDRKFPGRAKRFPEIKRMLESDRFNFGIDLSTFIFSLDVDIKASVVGYGSTRWNDMHFHNPAIRVESSTLYGSKSLVRRSIERLEKLVVEYYGVKEVRQSLSFTRELS